MIEDVLSGHFASIESLPQLAVHLVPWPPDVAMQEAFKGPEQVAEPFAGATVLTPAARRNELRLILVLRVGHNGKPLTPFTILRSAAMSWTLHDNFVHIRTHCLQLSKVSRRHRL
jgi:hypothetical protein